MVLPVAVSTVAPVLVRCAVRFAVSVSWVAAAVTVARPLKTLALASVTDWPAAPMVVLPPTLSTVPAVWETAPVAVTDRLPLFRVVVPKLVAAPLVVRSPPLTVPSTLMALPVAVRTVVPVVARCAVRLAVSVILVAPPATVTEPVSVLALPRVTALAPALMLVWPPTVSAAVCVTGPVAVTFRLPVLRIVAPKTVAAPLVVKSPPVTEPSRLMVLPLAVRTVEPVVVRCAVRFAVSVICVAPPATVTAPVSWLALASVTVWPAALMPVVPPTVNTVFAV